VFLLANLHNSLLSLELIRRHGATHNHDTVKVLTLAFQVLGDFIIAMVSLTDQNPDDLVLAKLVVFSLIASTILVVTLLDVSRSICTNKRPIHENKEEWLVTASQLLIILGVVSYYIGDNLPGIIDEFPEELNCDPQCEENVLIVGVFFLFLALTTFTFLPDLFRKINKIINEDYDIDHLCQEKFKTFQVQFFVLHMIGLILDFDAVYTAVWVYAFVDVENCDTNNIIGSSFCIATGWITWTIYALVFGYYLTHIRRIIKHFTSCKMETEHWVINGLFFGTLLLFFTTFFPVHILADNVEPLSCGCENPTNTSATVLQCVERAGVRETRVVFLAYQLLMFIALGVLGMIRNSFQQTKKP
jgi:hypothetical protein